MAGITFTVKVNGSVVAELRAITIADAAVQGVTTHGFYGSFSGGGATIRWDD